MTRTTSPTTTAQLKAALVVPDAATSTHSVGVRSTWPTARGRDAAISSERCELRLPRQPTAGESVEQHERKATRRNTCLAPAELATVAVECDAVGREVLGVFVAGGRSPRHALNRKI